jgi:hypothetical protein
MSHTMVPVKDIGATAGHLPPMLDINHSPMCVPLCVAWMGVGAGATRRRRVIPSWRTRVPVRETGGGGLVWSADSGKRRRKREGTEGGTQNKEHVSLGKQQPYPIFPSIQTAPLTPITINAPYSPSPHPTPQLMSHPLLSTILRVWCKRTFTTMPTCLW